MELKMVNISDIIPYENNPRHNEEAVEYVKESIRQCGYVAPIIVDENMVILAGHTRLLAIKSEGGVQTEVIVRSGLTEEQKRKYRLLDNKVGEKATWDFEKLEAELDGLYFNGFDFGFEENKDLSYLAELVENGLVNPEANDDYFQISFLFDKCNKQAIDDYVKRVGKDAISERITEDALNAK